MQPLQHSPKTTFLLLTDLKVRLHFLSMSMFLFVCLSVSFSFVFPYVSLSGCLHMSLNLSSVFLFQTLKNVSVETQLNNTRAFFALFQFYKYEASFLRLRVYLT